jgi:hypothetical protein
MKSILVPAAARRSILRRRAFIHSAARLLLAFGALALVLLAPLHGQKKDKKKDGPAPVTDTLIKVTTFTEMGGTLRGASVKLLPADKDGNPVKGKVLQGVTNSMGEFPFYVPKTEASYVLRAEAKGFVTTDKVVAVHGEDQLDVFLQLPGKK